MANGQVCKEWRAVRQGGHLVVAGACDFPRDGYTVLVTVGNQGTNPDPRELHLEVEVVEPNGGPQVLSTELAIGIFQNREAENVMVDGRRLSVKAIPD